MLHRRLLATLVVALPPLAIACAPDAGAATRVKTYGVSRTMFAEVRRVNICEEGGNWHVDGPIYSGGLGWLHATWDAFRKSTWPADMADAPPHMQANAMWRFVWHYHMAMPDQHGCTGGY